MFLNAQQIDHYSRLVQEANLAGIVSEAQMLEESKPNWRWEFVAKGLAHIECALVYDKRLVVARIRWSVDKFERAFYTAQGPVLSKKNKSRHVQPADVEVCIGGTIKTSDVKISEIPGWLMDKICIENAQ